MNKVMKAMRSRMDRIHTERALRHLDNHLLKDIGLPPREHGRRFGPF